MNTLRWINLALCLLGFILAVPLYYLTPPIYNDASIQSAAATHLLHGKGYVKYSGIKGGDFKEKTSPSFDQVEGWPPGYSILVAGASAIFGNSVYVRLGLLILAGLIITLCCFYLGELLLAPYPWIATGVWLAWILWAFPPLFNTDSDNITFASFCLAVVGMFQAWRTPGTLRWAMLTALALAGCAWLRFAYWGVLPVCALAYFFSAGRSRQTYRWLAVHLLTLAVLVVPLFIYQKLRIGHYSYLGAWKLEETVFHWAYLRFSVPFPLYIVVPDFHIPPIQLEFAWIRLGVLRLCEATLLGATAWSLWRFARSGFEMRVRGAAWLAGFSFSATVGMLIYHTLTVKSLTPPWVALAEPRYYAPAMLLLFFLVPKLLGEIQLRHKWFRAVMALAYLSLIVVFAPRRWAAVENLPDSVSQSWKRQQQAQEIWRYVEPKVRESSCVYLTDENAKRLSFGALSGAMVQKIETMSAILDTPPEMADQKCLALVVVERENSSHPDTQKIVDRLKAVTRISLTDFDLAVGLLR